MRKSKSKKGENGAAFTEEDDEPLANVASPPSEDYEVESIVAVRKRKGQTEYQVRWKGYTADADTWEPEEQLNCAELIEAFNNSSPKKGKPGRKRKNAKTPKTVTPKKRKAKNENADDGEDDNTEYEVEKILEVQVKRNNDRLFLVRWKGYSKKDDSWEPEENLQCQELIEAFMAKVDKAKAASPRETRVNRKKTEHYRVPPPKTGRAHKRRRDGPRQTYNEED